jgi:hypothetical protein
MSASVTARREKPEDEDQKERRRLQAQAELQEAADARLAAAIAATPDQRTSRRTQLGDVLQHHGTFDEEEIQVHARRT